ncbi:HAD family hydrolase, partial [Adlercreutzia equolifaciens]|uniref:HAD family hydrolase n=1 Tax=Adlercreutzia equolifaciens TaxID=446660 RepID=UPI0023AEE2C1
MAISANAAEGGSSVTVDGALEGAIQFRDEPKADAAAKVQARRQDFGVASYMVTGDAEATAQAIAAEVG